MDHKTVTQCNNNKQLEGGSGAGRMIQVRALRVRRASEKLLGAIMWGHRAIAIDLYCCLLQNDNEHSQVV